jgi:hypothetical protein
MGGVIGWLESSSLAVWTRESPSIWAYPTILTLHTVGLGIVVGANAVIDLTLLGFAPRLPLQSLAPLFPVIWSAFALNAVTGVVLFIADAATKSHQPVFFVKLTLIALALWNTVLVKRVVSGNREGSVLQNPPGRSQRLAVVSLLLWTGAIAAGRLMAYL